MKVKMKKIISVAVITIMLAAIFITCGDNGVEPNIEPGRRDYTWTVDTIYSPQNSLRGMWGYDSNNIWVVGPGGAYEKEEVWHYDGQKWNRSQESIQATPETIFGFTPTNIWLGGGDGRILRYNGTKWTQNYRYTPNYTDIYSTTITDIWGINENNIYAVGYNWFKSRPELRGFILHYDGGKWEEIYNANFYSNFFQLRKDKDNLIVWGLKLGNNEADTLVFWKLSNNSLNEVYSNSTEDIIWGSQSKLGDKYYYIIGKEAFEYSSNQLIKRLSFNYEHFGYNIYGRNEKDIFIYMTDGLAHYNGIDIEYMYKFNRPKFTYIDSNTFITDKECFFLLREAETGLFLILHGSLKN